MSFARSEPLRTLPVDEYRHVKLRKGVSGEGIVRKGSTIISPSIRPQHFILVRNGLVNVSLSPEYKDPTVRATVALLNGGEILGEAIFDGGPNTCYAQALKNTHIFYYSTNQAINTFRADLQFRETVTRGFSKRVEAALKYHELLRLPIPVRLASILLQLSNSGQDGISGITQEDLANLVASMRPYVTEVLGTFADEGIVTLGIKAVTVNNPKYLKQIAENEIYLSCAR